MTGRGSGAAPGTCGELVQGARLDGTLFQVSFPVDLWARVDVELAAAPQTHVDGLPETLWKLDAALRVAVHHFTGGCAHLRVRRINPLPVGKGFGSSSADVVAAIRAVAQATGRTVTPSEIMALAARIEPTDGIASNRPVAVTRDGRIMREWPWTPRFVVIAVAGQGEVDSCDADVGGARAHGGSYERLLATLDEAAERRDGSAFAAAATESAQLHLARTGGDVLHQILDVAGRSGALGVVVGHTGTCAGLLLPAASTRAEHEAAVRRLEDATNLEPIVLMSR